jgi:hypothetical protein
MVTIVPIRSSIEKLALSESNSIAIQNFCKEYKEKLDGGMHEEQICEQFVIDLSKIAESESAKAVLNDVNEAVKANESNIKLANSVYQLSKGSCMFVAPMIESAVVNYITDKNSKTRDDVRVNVSLFESDSTVQSILETLQYEQYEEKNGKTLVNAIIKEEFKTPEVKTYTQDEVDKILSDKVNEMAEAEKNAVKKTKGMIPNHVKLGESINAILQGCKNNEKVKVFCEQYIAALNAGKADELLYESFISGISNWNYLSAVDTELSALKGRVSQYKQDIDLKKILETMAQTGSYYIVPLIEDVVVDYVENKNMATRTILLQRLEAFEYDPFVRDMECLITRDLSIENTVYLGESVEYLNSQVKTELIFSPVQYIKENECVFNVKGAYYARKGTNIAKLTKNEVASLSESFKSLCNLVNADNVRISNDMNSITVYGNSNNICTITESEITLNGKEVTTDELKKLMESAINMQSDDAEFYAMSVALNEHYNDIAYIDFVKRIEARDNSGKSCDVFKLKESIFVNTTNSNLGRSTFYRNVNPIQCRKYINEHMEINCGPLFEDELPEQEKIEKSIEDKKKEYQDYIDSLEEKKETLKQMKDEGADTEDIDKAIEMIDKELEDTKNDFSKYQKDAEKYLNGDDDDADDSLKNEVPDTEDDDKASDTDDAENKDGDSEDKEDKAGDELDPDKESPEDMEQPLGDTVDTEGGEDAAEFEFPDEFADVAEYDPDFDVPTEVVKTETEQGQSTDINYGKFQIVKVSYNKNVKTGESNGKGEVILVIPSVDANGDVHDDTRKITFYLDDERKPVINNEYMPLDMYTQIVDAIENDPQTENINVVGSKDVKTETTPIETVPAETETEEQPIEKIEQDTVEEKPEDTGTEEPKEVSAEDIKAEITEPENKDDNRETPAETAEGDVEATYPINVGLYPQEIAPIEMGDFEKDLDDKMKIEHSESEDKDGEVILKIANKAQANALRKYFHTWMNYDDNQFNSYFPELQKCFDNHPTNIDVMPANESVQIKGVKSSSEDPFRVMLPCNESLCKLFGLSYDNTIEQFQIVPENSKEEMKIYESLYTYARKNNGNVEQDVIDILEKYGDKYGKICESSCSYKLNVPYNNFLEQKLKANGFNVETVNENMSTEILKDDYKKAKKILESFYGEAAPTEARDFFQFLNENVTITVKDDTTGKTVTINTDDFNGKTDSSTAENGVAPDFEDSFKNVTFNPEESLAFKDDEESADDEKGEDKKDEEKVTDNNEGTEDKESKETENGESNEENSEEEHSKESSEEDNGSDDKKSEDEKPKKKFKFKAKKADESLKSKDGKKLNESALPTAEPNVLDYVKCKDGCKGQIICKQADESFVVNVGGHTKIYPKSDLTMIHERLDLVECPFKFDANTLKGVYESYVNCGLFVNSTQVTPNDCKVQLLEFMNAKDDDEINIIVEGEKTQAMKKYIRITESLDELIDLANYSKATLTYLVEGVEHKTDVLVHTRDYNNYVMLKESTVPVRTLVFDENGETHLMNIPGGNLMIKESEDFFRPAYEKLMESAIAALS